MVGKGRGGDYRCNAKMIFLLRAVMSRLAFIMRSRRSWCSSSSSRKVVKMLMKGLDCCCCCCCSGCWGWSVVESAMVGGWVVVIVAVDDGCPSQVRLVPAMGWGQWVVWSGLLGGRVEGRG